MGPEDRLEIFDGNQIEGQSDPKFTLKGKYQDWGGTCPMVCSGNGVRIKYISSSSSQYWGAACFFHGLSDAELQEISSEERIKQIRSRFDFSKAQPQNIGVWDTPHPYFDNMNMKKVVKLAGAKRLYVFFDPKSLTEGCDWLTLYEGSENQDKMIQQISGNFNEIKPIKIEGDTFNLSFTSDGSVVYWGVRMYILGWNEDHEPEFDWETLTISLADRDKRDFVTLEVRALNPAEDEKKMEEVVPAKIGLAKWKVWETSHPCESKLDQTFFINIPNAKHLLLVMDTQSKLELNSDFVKVSKSKDTVLTAPDFSLTGEFGNGIYCVYKLEGTSSCCVRVCTDDSICDWGLRMFIYPQSTDGENFPYTDMAIAYFLSEKYASGELKIAPVIAEEIQLQTTPANTPAPTDGAKGGQDPKSSETSKQKTDPRLEVNRLISTYPDQWFFWESPKSANADMKEEVKFLDSSARRIVVIPDPRCRLDGYKLTVSYRHTDDEVIPVLEGDSYFKANVDVPANNISILVEGSGGNPASDFGFRLYFFISQKEQLESIQFADCGSMFYSQSQSFIEFNHQAPSGLQKLQLQPTRRFDVAVWETSHPTQQFSTINEDITIPGALKLVISFDSRSDLGEGESLRLSKDKDSVNVFEGSFSRDYVISGDTVKIKYKSGAFSAFGLRIFIRGLTKDDFCYSLSKLFKPVLSFVNSFFDKSIDFNWDFLDSSVIQVWETAHPYTDNMNVLESKNIPGASKLLIVFDPQTKTELGCDFLQVYQGMDKNTPLLKQGDPRGISGEYPAFEESCPIEVQGDSVSFGFVSDGSVTRWGVRAYILGVFDEEKLKPNEKTFSIADRPKAPLCISYPAAYAVDLVQESLRRSSMTPIRSIEKCIVTEHVVNEQIRAHVKAHSPYELGKFLFQRKDLATKNYAKLIKMLMHIHASRIAYTCLGALTREEVIRLDTTFKYRNSVPLRLLWAAQHTKKGLVRKESLSE
eukprot:TRINITY_DN5426_c0_g1_i1.p1 TRINITY_DN5426_c0_g1~~TRINITY_DN5426_c0_g1_i1.p1  ORF type:complete len:1085 (+),score=263.49 TRINITY_DN5426_c0_g1_i1:315-3257(+)